MGLQEDLMKDIASAEQGLAKTSEATATSNATQPRPSGFLPKALRIKGKLVGEQELQNHKNKISESIDKLIEVEGVIDEAEKAQMKKTLTDRFNKFSMEMLRKGLDFEARQKTQIRDAQARLQGSSLLKGIAGGITSTLVSNLDFDKMFGGKSGFLKMPKGGGQNTPDAI